METRLRLLITLAGLPTPTIDHRIRDASGHAFIRLDLAYPDVRVAVEYEGRQHADSSYQWLRDLGRREWLDVHDWRLIVVTAEGIFRDPGQTLERVQAALRDRGIDCNCSSDEWRRHFLKSGRS